MYLEHKIMYDSIQMYMYVQLFPNHCMNNLHLLLVLQR